MNFIDFINEIATHSQSILMQNKDNLDRYILIYDSENKNKLYEALLDRQENNEDEETIDVFDKVNLEAMLDMKLPDALHIFFSNQWDILKDPMDYVSDTMEDLKEREIIETDELYTHLFSNALETMSLIDQSISELIILMNHFNLRFKQMYKLDTLNNPIQISGKDFYHQMKEESISKIFNDPNLNHLIGLTDLSFSMLSEDADSYLAFDHLKNLLKLHYVQRTSLIGEE